MAVLRKIVKWLAAALVVLIAAAGFWLWFAPPELIRVGAGYTAKIVCSNVFLAGRDAAEVQAVDVQAPGHPLLKLINVAIDHEAGVVRAHLLGYAGEGVAVYRPGTGCASAPDGDVEKAKAFSFDPGDERDPDDSALWPAGERVDPSQDPELAKILEDTDLTGPGMRAVVVVHNGRIIGERYGHGFDPGTPLLGWSMTKTVTAALLGTLIADGKLALSDTQLLPAWDGVNKDIALADMLGMASGLAWNEGYGSVSDVTRMLYLEPDMAGFAQTHQVETAISHTFNYSSGTSVLLSRLWQDRVGDDALRYPHDRLFQPLGMASATLEADARGAFVGSSYLYATARDWARFGQFLIQDGMWNGRRLLPEGFVALMSEAHPASNGQYSRAHTWLRAPNEYGAAETQLPAGSFWLSGHDGQSVAVIPAKNLVIVRLGLTPSRLGYRAGRLAMAVMGVVGNSE